MVNAEHYYCVMTDAYLLLVLIEQLGSFVQIPPCTLLNLCTQFRLLLFKLLDIDAGGSGNQSIQFSCLHALSVRVRTFPC